TEQWGSGVSLDTWAPTLAADRSFRSWFGRFERLSVPRGSMRQAWEEIPNFDMRSVLGLIQAPTLVIGHEGGRLLRPGHARYLAEHIAGSELVILPGHDCLYFADDEIIRRAIEFLASDPTAVRADHDRVLAAVLFTDLVSSTERAVELGDKKWRNLLDDHDAIVHREVEREGGRFVKNTGDGALATFDGPARAIRSAVAIRTAVSLLGVDVRAGIHAGEVEVRGGDVGGVAVHLAARVMESAAPGEVLISRTVKDLTAGSELELIDRGLFTLKGIDEPWQLYAIR
ncbi:MAG TPA: adenylate/guanylate cyclase domain-containing protein, partial [Acidimicrobiales bacterium]|nr:adenylate/guanylate cyclase domain-containing protein [Acidimicrobiales bacterium]